MTIERPMFPPVDPTRRHFLSQAAGVAAGGTVLALAIPAPAAANAPRGRSANPDPVFGLIEAHRTATDLHGAALKEQARLEQIGDPRASEVGDASCHADARTFRALVNTAPQTFAGLQAWAFYLDEVRRKEEWMIEEEAPAIVMTLARSLERGKGSVFRPGSNPTTRSLLKWPRL
jgi:hypothetical protein